MDHTDPATIFRTASPDGIYTALYAGLFFFMVIVGLWILVDEGDVLPLILLSAIALFIVLPFIVRAFYPVIIVTGANIYVKQFFTLYKADIKNITKIRKGETMWSGFYKFGYRTGGLTVFCKYRNDLYITPENECLFVETLMKINPGIAWENVSKPSTSAQ